MDDSLELNLGLEGLRWLRRLARRLVQDPDDADDAVQDTVLAALTRAPGNVNAPRGWLAKVLQNAVRQGRRGAARRATREREAGVREPARSTAEVVEELAWHRTLVDQVNALAEPYRSTIVLRFLRDRNPREIAREQDVPVKTVHTRIERGLEHLRRSLDRGHGGDRASWMSAVTALAAPVDSGVATGALVIGGIAMGTMMKVSAAVVVAAACVYFVTRTPQAESSRMATLEPPAADVELVGSAPTSAFEDPATQAGQRSPVADESPIGVATVAGTNVLRVILEGIDEGDARMTRVTLTGVDERNEWPAEIRDSWPCQGLTSEFDLDPFLASVAEQDGILRVDELEVYVDHPLHLVETTRVPLSRGVQQKSGQTVYEVRVRLVPAGVIHGQLSRADGAPAAEGLVGALLLEGDFPVEDEGRAVECAADGAFELRVPGSGPYALASFEEGRRPTTTRVEAVVGTRVDVGTLVLESGHAITGIVLRRGEPLAGATVSATPPTWKTAAAPDAVNNGMHSSVYEGRTFTTPTRSVHLLWLPPSFSSRSTESGYGSRRNGRFEFAGQRVAVDEHGVFVVGGLGSGEYLLRIRELADAHDSLPGYWDDSEAKEMYRIHGDRPALVVRAPAHGVVFELRWTSIRFELAGDLESEDVGRLVLKTPSAHPTPVDETGKDLRLVADPLAKNLNFTPAFMTTEFPLSGDEPTYVLQAPPNKHLTGEVAFPGRQPVPFEFSTPESGGEVVVPIQLVRAEELATLVIELENPQAELPDAFSVKLWRHGQDDAPPDNRPVEVVEGQLRLENIFPGKYRVRVHAGEDPYSAGLFHANEFHVELHPGLVVTQSITMQQGAGLRFTVRDEDGALLTGEYEFFDDLGSRVDLNTQVRRDDSRWASSWTVYPYGTHESFNELHPGRYRLVLLSQGYDERSVTLELRAGEYEDVDVTLSK